MIINTDRMDSESDQENNKADNNKRTRTKKQQFDLIVAFYQQHNEELLSAEMFDHLWNRLTDELNCIGPPTHSRTEWRRVWTDYKYNRKRKRSSDTAPESQPLSTIFLGNIQNYNQLAYSNPISFVYDKPANGNLLIDDNVPLIEQQPSLDNISIVFAEPVNFIQDNESSNNTTSNNTIESNHGHDQPQQIVDEVNFRSEILKKLDAIARSLDVLIQLALESNNLKRLGE